MNQRRRKNETNDTELEEELEEKREKRWRRKVPKELVFVRDFKEERRSWHQVILLR